MKLSFGGGGSERDSGQRKNVLSFEDSVLGPRTNFLDSAAAFGRGGRRQANTTSHSLLNHISSGRGQSNRGFSHGVFQLSNHHQGMGFGGQSLKGGNNHFPRDADEDEYDESEYDPPPIARETLIEMLSDEWQPLQIADRLSTKESGFCIRLEERGKDQEMIQTILEVVGKMCSCEESSITMYRVLEDLINNRFANEAKRFLLDLPHRGFSQEVCCGLILNTLHLLKHWLEYDLIGCEKSVKLLIPVVKNVVATLGLRPLHNIYKIIEEVDVSAQEIDDAKIRKKASERFRPAPVFTILSNGMTRVTQRVQCENNNEKTAWGNSTRGLEQWPQDARDHICPNNYILNDPTRVLAKCQEPCVRSCWAGHKECRNQCFQKCECGRACDYRLSCGHVCARRCHDDDRDHDAYQCMKQCEKSCKYGHKCSKKCCEPCQCLKKVNKTIPTCDHQQVMRCFEDPSDVICESPCPRTLTCGHQCSGKCGYPCGDRCKKIISVQGKCGHRFMVPCSESANLDLGKCDEKCAEILKCGHPCRGTCGSCFQGRLHEGCGTKCERPLFCGHLCRENCPSNCPPCTQPCKTSCVHSRCYRLCLEACVPCIEPCQWKCEHFQCGKRCSEPCDRPPCNEPCKKRLKRCGHRCIGLCGEPCPKLCRICDEEKVTEIFFGDENKKDSRFVELSDCGHCFTFEVLDTWFNQTDNESNSKIDIKLKECPRCKTPVWRSTRYGQFVNRQLHVMNDVRRKIAGSFDDVQQAKDALKAAFASQVKVLSQYPGEMNKLRESARLARSLTSLTVVEAQFNCLVKLSNIQQDLPKLGDKATTLEGKKGVTNQMQNLVNWLFRERSYFSEQETTDLEFEAQKLTLSVKYLLLKEKYQPGVVAGTQNHMVKISLDQAKSILFGGSPFNQSKADEVEAIFDRILVAPSIPYTPHHGTND
ncbi:NFX1-type zinc finger-containing protein 1-like isoform X2 [Clavelina lepadiformis]|uniref:NFX1-type zinc finger-containing protein 1-like isoform X2 n=1 Tax=Clavelina lepadiformis TaxID=159417 RepID=UPI004042FAC8